MKEEEDLEDDSKPVHKWESMHHTSGRDETSHFQAHIPLYTPSNPIPRLLIKSAILMPSAKKDDINIVQIESEGYNKEKVLFSLIH